MAKRISEWHPALYALRVWQKGMARHGSDWRQRATFASHLESETLPFVVKRHQSLLRRKLGDSDPRLQENKVVNLSIARQTIDGIIIEPGQTFSFWRCVGNATSQKGYVEGMRLSRGEVKVGVGGGLCQLGNLLYWMALHSPLVVSERHHHSFDPFPDEGRVLPFGSGASLFYPYLDLRFYNPTSVPIQLRVWLTDDHLKGLVAAGEELPESFHIFERNHRFLRRGGTIYRQNEIWRRVTDRRNGQTVREERLVANFAEVKYALPAEVAASLDLESCNVAA